MILDNSIESVLSKKRSYKRLMRKADYYQLIPHSSWKVVNQPLKRRTCELYTAKLVYHRLYELILCSCINTN